MHSGCLQSVQACCILQVSAILHLTRTDSDCARLAGAGSVYRSSLYLDSYEYILQRSSIFHLQNGVLVTQDNAMRYIMRRENEKKVGNLRPGFTSPHLLSSNVKCNTLPQVWHLEYSIGLIWSKFLCPAQTVGSNLSRLIKTGENQGPCSG